MTKLEQAARQALEALREYRDTQMISAPRKAIEVLREALAEQAEQEPMYISKYCVKSGCACHYSTAVDGEPVAVYTATQTVSQEPVAWLYRGELHWENPSEWAKGEVTPLYTDIPKSNTEQHPIARVPAHPEQGLEWFNPPPVWGTLLYTAPLAQQDTHATHVVRTKDLTDEELWEAAKTAKSNDLTDAFRAVIAADREKNK